MFSILKNTKTAFFISIILIIVLGLYCIAITYIFKLEILAKVENRKKHKIVMFGDSQIYNADWKTQLHRNDVYNGGTPGFTTSHFIWQVRDKVIKHQPTICFIEGGINDIAVGIPLQRTFNNFESLIDTLLSNHIIPVMQSTIHVNYTQDSIINLKVDSLNAYLKNLAQRKHVEFIDLNASLASKNRLKSNLTYDGTHVNQQGYELWALKVKKVLNKKKI